jgi:DDE family transposase
MFSYISINWRAKPLASYQVVLDLIAATTTNTGLKIYARLDTTTYETKLKITDAQINAVNITRDTFHGEWNYTIGPKIPPLINE